MSEQKKFARISFCAIRGVLHKYDYPGMWVWRDRKCDIRSGARENVLIGLSLDDLIPDIRRFEGGYFKVKSKILSPETTRLIECVLSFGKNAKAAVRSDMLRGDVCAVNFGKAMQRKRLSGCDLLCVSRFSLGLDIWYKFIFLANPRRDISVAILQSTYRRVAAGLAEGCFQFASDVPFSADKHFLNDKNYPACDLSKSEEDFLAENFRRAPKKMGERHVTAAQDSGNGLSVNSQKSRETDGRYAPMFISCARIATLKQAENEGSKTSGALNVSHDTTGNQCGLLFKI